MTTSSIARPDCLFGDSPTWAPLASLCQQSSAQSARENRILDSSIRALSEGEHQHLEWKYVALPKPEVRRPKRYQVITASHF
jgi:hypothetical protein